MKEIHAVTIVAFIEFLATILLFWAGFTWVGFAIASFAWGGTLFWFAAVNEREDAKDAETHERAGSTVPLLLAGDPEEEKGVGVSEVNGRLTIIRGGGSFFDPFDNTHDHT